MKYKFGLSSIEVKKRIKEGLVNYDTTTKSKTTKEILVQNIFTLFNFINIVLAIAILWVKSYKNLLFLGVCICNTLISSIQEIRAKKIVDKLSVISSKKVKVIRDFELKEIFINEIVLDDAIKFELGDQIVTDSIILDGMCEVNESFITGEAKTIIKKQGDTVLSGSFVVSGSAIGKVIHIGTDNYTAVITRDAKKLKQEISSQIVKSLNKIIKYISISLIPIGLLLLYRQFSISGNTTQNAIVSVASAILGMIPEGLILLVSTVLAISSVKLSKVKVLVQDLYAIETLARVDTICLDKTGTITEGKMEVNDIIPLNNFNMNDIEDALSIISTNLDDKNPTFIAINNKYGNTSNIKTKKVIHFSSDKKYSGVCLDDYSYIIGAPEFILKDNKKYKDKYEELSEYNRVLMLIKCYDSKNVLESKKEVMAFILIKDKIRESASSIIEYYNDNDIDVKIISGDNSKTIISILKEVGVEINNVVDMSTLDGNIDYNTLVNENNVFTRVKPDEKKLIIKALKENGHIVAMTGDGVNDVLALKEADCGIAMNSGASAARNVAEFVLLDSDFSSVPNIIKEGRKTINNIERSATLFLSKTIYASLLAIIFLFLEYIYPFEPIQMSIINTLTIGIPAFILALEPNYNRVKDKFLINVISKAIPSGITTVINILLLVFMAGLLRFNNEQTSTIAVIITAYTAILLIYRISKPLNKLRKLLLIFLTILFLLALLTNIGRYIYSLVLLNPNSVLILVVLMYVSTRVFVFFSKLLNQIIIKKPNWFN